MKPFVITQNKKSHGEDLYKVFFDTSIRGEGVLYPNDALKLAKVYITPCIFKIMLLRVVL